MKSLLIEPDLFSVRGGQFASNKRYLFSTNDSTQVEVVLPVLGSFTLDIMGQNDPVPYNFQYSILNYTVFTEGDSGFRPESETLGVQK